MYKQSIEDPEGFWAGVAKELHWFKPWDKVLEWNLPSAKWFVGGKLNLSYNCLDRHVESERAHKTAIIWEGNRAKCGALPTRNCTPKSSASPTASKLWASRRAIASLSTWA